MPRIREFRFTLSDAWNNIAEGYDSILETSDNGNVAILVLVNSKPYRIPLTSKEQEFICDMCFLENWNQKRYVNDYVIDGYMWRLSYAYDDIHITASGINGYPPDFLEFLNLLHCKYHVPKADIENETNIRAFIKDTTVFPLEN